MSIDLNADIGDLFGQFFSKKGLEGRKAEKSPYANLILFGLLTLVMIVLYTVYVFLPAQKELEIKREQVHQIDNLRVEIEMLDQQLKSAQQSLKHSKERYQELTKLFHTDQELEDLYRHISMLSLAHQLMVSKLEKEGETPIFEVAGSQGEETFEGDEDMTEPYLGLDDQSESKKVAYYRLRVKFEITGNYARYTLFRRDLAKLKKIVNIDQEVITVFESEKSRGDVKVEAVISTYRMPSSMKEKHQIPNEVME